MHTDATTVESYLDRPPGVRRDAIAAVRTLDAPALGVVAGAIATTSVDGVIAADDPFRTEGGGAA